MLKEKEFANAFTVVSLGVYVVCRVLSLIAPDFLFSVGKSWFHTFSLDSMRAVSPMDLGTFIFGAVSLALRLRLSADRQAFKVFDSEGRALRLRLE